MMDDVERAIEPVRIGRILLKVAAVVVIGALAFCAAKFGCNLLFRAEDNAAVRDQLWHARTQGEIDTLAVEIQAVEHALAQNESEIAKMWIVRGGQLEMRNSLTDRSIKLRRQRAELVASLAAVGS